MGHTRKYESKRTAAWGLGQGTLELIKVGRFVIQAGLKSTGQESKCLGAQLQLPGEGCRVGAGAHRWRGTHVYAGAGQAPQ